MNLIEDRWIPVGRRSGKVEHIAPSQLTDGFADDPFIRLALPRPDFNGALIQFLVGLLQTHYAPKSPREWRQRLRQPPPPEELENALSSIAEGFHLDGHGPRFLQDLTLEQEISKLKPGERAKRLSGISGLLITSPTGKTLEDNTDHFVKRGGIHALCPACAGAALFTMQTNAPAGGQGHRTGIRGGGPLTTLVLGGTLWATCWLNVLEREDFVSHVNGNPAKDGLSDRFPWLGPTRTSERRGQNTKKQTRSNTENDGGLRTTPDDAHSDQIFWAMPRRIRLLFERGVTICDLCGNTTDTPVRQFLTKNLGVNYTGAWKHPLSPYRIDANGNPIPLHPQPGGIGYRDWLGLVQSSDGSKGRREPARVVGRYLREGGEDLRLWAFGYDIVGGQDKARCWYDGTMPLVLIRKDLFDAFAYAVSCVVNAAQYSAGTLVLAVVRANYFKVTLSRAGVPGWEVPKRFKAFKNKDESETDDVASKQQKALIESSRSRVWSTTEPSFFETLFKLRDVLNAGEDPMPLLEMWQYRLIQSVERIFDDVSESDAFDAADPKRIALAWRDLQRALRGKKMREILGLT